MDPLSSTLHKVLNTFRVRESQEHPLQQQTQQTKADCKFRSQKNNQAIGSRIREQKAEALEEKTPVFSEDRTQATSDGDKDRLDNLVPTMPVSETGHQLTHLFAS